MTHRRVSIIFNWGISYLMNIKCNNRLVIQLCPLDTNAVLHKYYRIIIDVIF